MGSFCRCVVELVLLNPLEFREPVGGCIRKVERMAAVIDRSSWSFVASDARAGSIGTCVAVLPSTRESTRFLLYTKESSHLQGSENQPGAIRSKQIIALRDVFVLLYF